MKKYLMEMKKICENGCKRYGIDFDIPIRISGQMKKTYGHVRYSIDYENGTYTPMNMVIAKFLFEDGNQEELIDTLLHELAHYIVLKQHPTEQHEHDEVWKKVARELGCKDEQYANRANLGNPPKPKYVIKCCECNATSNYYRKSKVVSNIDLYRCKCGGKLKLD